MYDIEIKFDMTEMIAYVNELSQCAIATSS